MAALLNNAIKRKGRRTPFQMGDAMAREIEVALKLPEGWMDTSFCGEDDDFRVRAIKLINSMPLDQVSLAVDLLEVLTKHGIQE